MNIPLNLKKEIILFSNNEELNNDLKNIFITNGINVVIQDNLNKLPNLKDNIKYFYIIDLVMIEKSSVDLQTNFVNFLLESKNRETPPHLISINQENVNQTDEEFIAKFKDITFDTTSEDDFNLMKVFSLILLDDVKVSNFLMLLKEDKIKIDKLTKETTKHQEIYNQNILKDYDEIFGNFCQNECSSTAGEIKGLTKYSFCPHKETCKVNDLKNFFVNSKHEIMLELQKLLSISPFERSKKINDILLMFKNARTEFCLTCPEIKHDINFKKGDVLISNPSDLVKGKCSYCPKLDCKVHTMFALFQIKL